MIAALTLVACGERNAVGNDLLRAEANGARLTISTSSDDTVYFFAVDRAALPLIDWIQCTRPTDPCPRVSKGKPVSIPYAQLVWQGEGGGEQAHVSFWRLNPPPTYGVRGRVETLRVPLRPPVTPFSP